MERHTELDVISGGIVWTKIWANGALQFNDDHRIEIVALFDGKVTFSNN